MSDRTPADAIADAFEAARPTFEQNFLADHYELIEDVETTDAYGGRTTAEEVKESGRCMLKPEQRLGTEGGSIVVAAGPYTAMMPKDTIATENDRIRINGREFAITASPIRPGSIGSPFTQLTLEERSRS